jgi:Ca-activated chloride channel family protein
MKYPKPLRFSYLLAFITIFTASIIAQTPKPTPPIEEDNEIIKISSRLVMVPVSVTDANGQPVPGLTAQDFFITEENRQQEIAQISEAEDVPLEIVLLFDVSASTDAMFQFEIETAIKFLQEVMRSDDRVTIFTIGERPVLVQHRDTAEKSVVSIKNIQPTKEFTAFYDTVRAAADYLQKNAPTGRRKVIVAITDGEDTNSEGIRRAINEAYRKLGSKIDSLDQKSLYQLTVKSRNEASVREQNRVLKALQNADAVFYAVNPAGNSLQLNKMSQFGQEILDKFATDTGGTAFLLKFLPTNLKDDLQNSYNSRKNQEMLTEIFRRLAGELQAQYLLQYYSEADYPENRYVNLEVGLKNPRNFRVRARQGYFVK